MDYGTILNESFQYAKEGVRGKWKKWFFLIVSMIIFPFILGYMVRIYRGEKPAPKLQEWGLLFVEGLKLFVVQIIYALPVILLIIAAFLPFFSSLFAAGLFTQNSALMTDTQAEELFSSHPEILSSLVTMLVLFVIAIIVAFIIGLFSFIGTVRFARTGSIREAFNFSAILVMIRRLGWINYLLALIIIGVLGMVYGIVMNLFMMIPFIGFIIWFFMYPPFMIFVGRYTCLVYDVAEKGDITP